MKWMNLALSLAVKKEEFGLFAYWKKSAKRSKSFTKNFDICSLKDD